MARSWMSSIQALPRQASNSKRPPNEKEPTRPETETLIGPINRLKHGPNTVNSQIEAAPD